MTPIETVQALDKAVTRLMHIGCESAVAEGRYGAEWVSLVEQTRALLAQMQAEPTDYDWSWDARERAIQQSAPVVQVVEPLTEDEIDDTQEGAYRTLRAKGFNGGMGGEQWDRASAIAIVQACARKWGLSLKENT